MSFNTDLKNIYVNKLIPTEQPGQLGQLRQQDQSERSREPLRIEEIKPLREKQLGEKPLRAEPSNTKLNIVDDNKNNVFDIPLTRSTDTNFNTNLNTRSSDPESNEGVFMLNARLDGAIPEEVSDFDQEAAIKAELELKLERERLENEKIVAEKERLENEKNMMGSNKSQVKVMTEQINNRYKEYVKLFTENDLTKITVKRNKKYIKSIYKKKNKDILKEIKTEYDKVNRLDKVENTYNINELDKILNECSKIFDDFNKIDFNKFSTNDRKIKNIIHMYEMTKYIEDNKAYLDVKPRITKLFTNYVNEVDETYNTKTLEILGDLYTVKENADYTEIIKYINTLIIDYVHQDKEDYTLYNTLLKIKVEFNSNLTKISENYKDTAIDGIIAASEKTITDKIVAECMSYKTEFKNIALHIDNNKNKNKINKYSTNSVNKNKTIFNHYSTTTINGLANEPLAKIKLLNDELEKIDKEFIETKNNKITAIKTSEDEDKKFIKKVLTSCMIDKFDENKKSYDDLHTEFLAVVDTTHAKIATLDDATHAEQKAVFDILNDAATTDAYNEIKTETDKIVKVNIDNLNTFITDKIADVKDTISHDELDALSGELDTKIKDKTFTDEKDIVNVSLTKCYAVNGILSGVSTELIKNSTFNEEPYIAKNALEQIRLAMELLSKIINELNVLKSKFTRYEINVEFVKLLIENYKLLQDRNDKELEDMKKMLKPIRDFKNNSVIELMNDLSVDTTTANVNNYEKLIKSLIQVAINDYNLNVIELIKWLGNETNNTNPTTAAAKETATGSTPNIIKAAKDSYNKLRKDNSTFNENQLSNYIYLSIQAKFIDYADLYTQIDVLCGNLTAAASFNNLLTTDAASYLTADTTQNIKMTEVYTHIKEGQKVVSDIYDMLNNPAFIVHYQYKLPNPSGVDVELKCDILNKEYLEKAKKIVKHQEDLTAVKNDLATNKFPDLEKYMKDVHDVLNTFAEFDDTTYNAFVAAFRATDINNFNIAKTDLTDYLSTIDKLVKNDRANAGILDDLAIVVHMAGNPIAVPPVPPVPDFLTKISNKIAEIQTDIIEIDKIYNDILNELIVPANDLPKTKYDAYVAELNATQAALKLVNLTNAITNLTNLDFDAEITKITHNKQYYIDHSTAITSTIPTFKVLKKVYEQAQEYLQDCEDKLTKYKQITEKKLEDYKTDFTIAFNINSYIDFVKSEIITIEPGLTAIFNNAIANFTTFNKADTEDAAQKIHDDYETAFNAEKILIDGDPAVLPLVPPAWEAAWDALLTGTTKANAHMLANFDIIPALNIPYIKGGNGRGVVSNICVFTFNNIALVLITIIILYIIYHMLYIDTNNALYRLVNKCFKINRHRQKRLPNYACDMQINTRYNRNLYAY